MNEAFSHREGWSFLHLAKSGACRGLVRKNMTDSFEARGDFLPETTADIQNDIEINVIRTFLPMSLLLPPHRWKPLLPSLTAS
ncbi:hypothetical protein LP416_22510 [Polaromonas sp. P2-4]|nr:hypothetical protein LP416_22510 [Polaromonas sp. P2-4]